MNCRSVLAAAVVALLARSAFAQEAGPVTLKMGDPAPPLVTGKFVKGEPVTKIEAGKMYVVEFWATWCGPCRATIPHLSELSKKNPDIIFIGQDVWENDEAAVEPFVKEMGDKMAYRVALDTKPGQDGEMAKTWMRAAGQNGIPTAFLVDKESKIAWIGHPMELEGVLEKVKAGTYDVKAIGEQKAKEAAINARLRTAMQKKDIDAAMKAADEMAAIKPDAADAVLAFQFRVLTQSGRTKEAMEKAGKIAASSKQPEALNSVAWGIAIQPTPTPESLKVARTAIDRAIEITESRDASLIDTSARVHAAAGEWDKAVAQQQTAVEKAPGEAKAEFTKTLESYKKQELPKAE